MAKKQIRKPAVKKAPKPLKPEAQARPAPEPEPEPPPLDARESLIRIARYIAAEKGFAPREQEIASLVEDQFMGGHDRERARFHRNADQSLIQALERDERFAAAVETAKGGVF